MNKPSGYIDVDRLQAETTLEQAAAKCGVPLDVKGGGGEVRIDCQFGCAGDHCGRKEIAINTENLQKVFQCHAYECGFRGNLLALMHGFLTGSKPSGGKLKGDEFQRVKKVLAGTGVSAASRAATKPPMDAGETATPPLPVNKPLSEASEERVRELHDIHEKLVRDIARMNPVAECGLRTQRDI